MPHATASGVATSPQTSDIENLPQQVLFRAGTGGYGCYRIPALVTTGDGSLLAFAEGRKTQSCGDRGDNDLVVRRSTNDGRTWGPIKVVPAGDTALGAYGPGSAVPAGTGAGSPVTRSNPAPVVDKVNHRVYLLSTSNPVNFNYPRTPWVQESSDDGLTWSAPTALDVSLAPSPSASDWFATGPGHGVQLTRGANKDRLVVGAHQQSRGGVYAGYLYLDPGAGNPQWRATRATDSYAAGGKKPSEVSVTEVAGGEVLLAARDEGATGAHRLGYTTDETPPGDTVPQVGAFTDASLPSPSNIQGSVLTLRQADPTRGVKEEVLLSAPAGLDEETGKPTRAAMTIWSRCGGTWKTAGQRVAPDRAAYSDLALLEDEEIGLLYEGGATRSADEIRFTRFSQEQLATGCDPSPPGSTSTQAVPALDATTPDASPQANDTYLSSTAATLSTTDPLRGPGDAALNNNNLALAAGGYADVPYARSLRTGTGDFTYSLWFKYQAQTLNPTTESDHILFWSNGTGTAPPQVWLRTQRNTNRLYAWAQSSGTDQARATLQDTSACACTFGDNAWHFVTLTRTMNRLDLQVDSGPVGVPAGAVTGDVSGSPGGSALGIRIGAKPVDASGTFVGKIDEFRLYRSALSAGRRASLATAGTSRDPATDTTADENLVLRLPFQVLDRTTAVNTTVINGTDDESGHCTDGTLLGAKKTDTGRFNEALQVSSALPGATSELTPALDVADRDFTYAMWFKFSGSAGSGPRALLWAYGPNATRPAQLWVQAVYRTEGTTLMATVESDTGSLAQVETDADGQNFGDDEWHLFLLQRHGGAVQLDAWGVQTVDGKNTVVLQASKTASGVLSGSLTGTRASGITGVRVGSKPDGTKVLNGALDDFRLYDHALSAAERSAVATGGALSPTSGLSVRWSFDDKYLYTIPASRAAPETTPATPDHSGWCNNAHVLNGGSIDAAGKLGTGLRLDGTPGTAAVVPYSPSLALAPEAVAPSTRPRRQGETSDFTLSLWFTYAATPTTQDQVLLWAYGAGGGERQVWLRASPTNDGVYADVETGTAGVRVLAPDATENRAAFGDNAWHHLALVRSGDSLTLSVDDLASQTATAELGAGALTATDTFAIDGLRLGGKPDGTQTLNGSLDEVRVYRQALGASDLAALRATPGSPPSAAPVLWLPFDTITARSYSRM